MTTLENSYCVPKTEEEWALLNPNLRMMAKWPDMAAYKKPNKSVDAIGIEDIRGMQEIPVQHFVELVEDSPSTWRIKEYQASKGVRDGFWHVFYISQSHVISVEQDGSFNLNGRKVYITTFTDLLTLIKFLTPPTK